MLTDKELIAHLRGIISDLREFDRYSGYQSTLNGLEEDVGLLIERIDPVVHGRWIDRSDKGVISMTHPYVCNRCGRVEMLKEPYCNCGARMDGE